MKPTGMILYRAIDGYGQDWMVLAFSMAQALALLAHKYDVRETDKRPGAPPQPQSCICSIQVWDTLRYQYETHPVAWYAPADVNAEMPEDLKKWLK